MAYEQHKTESASIVARCAVITLSDTRTEANDTSGARIRSMLTEAGHTVPRYSILPDDPTQLGIVLNELLHDSEIDAVLTNGGTGISPRDQTLQAITQRIDVPIPGFGELFRMLSWQQIGSGAMLSRAEGGIARGKLIFAMPGSTKAVELAMEKLILPEIKHLLHELRKTPT